MLEIKNITKIFNKEEGIENQKVVLNDLSFKVEDGDFITIIGGNGSGKTTMMNVISGVLTPDSGNIIIDGIDVTFLNEDKRAKYIGRVFQDPQMGTAYNMSLLENLEIASRRGYKSTLRWGFKKENKERFINILKEVDLGLETKLNQKVRYMSGGQRQVVALIMATLNTPRVLLLDEHTAALDPKISQKVLELTDKIVRREHITTLMITHNMKDAIKYGNRLIMISGGKIIVDVKGKEKENLTIEELLQKFEKGNGIVSDKMLF